MPDRRTPEHVRGEIEAEREQIAAALVALGADARRLSRLGSIAVAAATGLVALRRLIAGRRAD